MSEHHLTHTYSLWEKIPLQLESAHMVVILVMTMLIAVLVLIHEFWIFYTLK